MIKLAGMCLNWKVLLALAAVAVGIVLFAPQVPFASLSLLLVAACPLSMLLMMWGMRRAMGGGQHAPPGHPASQAAAPDLPADERLADLKGQQAAIARAIAEVESSRPHPQHK